MPLIDEIEALRKQRLVAINTAIRNLTAEEARRQLQATYGQVYDTRELSAEFEVLGFMAPYAVARRKSDGMLGSLEFTHSPRFYFFVLTLSGVNPSWARSPATAKEPLPEIGLSGESIPKGVPMSRRSNRIIRLPCFGITVRLNRQHAAKGPGAGTITSKLKGPEKTAAEWLRNAAIDGLESLILAHACADVDVKSPAYLEGIEMAVEAITNRFH